MKKAIQLLKIIIIIHFILNAALVALLISDESTTVAVFLSISSATVLIELYAYREIISTNKLLDAINPLNNSILTIKKPDESIEEFLDRHGAAVENQLEIELAQQDNSKPTLKSVINNPLRKKAPHEHKFIPIEELDPGHAKFICSVPGCGQTC